MSQTPTPPGGSDARIFSGMQGPAVAGAKNYIIVGGEPLAIDGANCVSFKDPGALSFMSGGPEGSLIEPRRFKGKELTTIEECADVVRGILIHSDITADAAGCYRVLKMRGLSTHFMVDWNGTIYQGTDPLYSALHGGGADNTLQNTNLQTIGIDMNCMLVKVTGDSPPPGSQGKRRIFEATINGEPWRSIGYTDAQYDALTKLIRALKQRFPKIILMPPIGPDKKTMLEQTELDLGKCGIFGHFHLNAQKIDPGPGFEWERLIADLNRQANSFPAIIDWAKDGKPKNIDTVYSEPEVTKLAEAYFRNTEDPRGGVTGGYYPVGQSGQWHGGIHLHLPKGAPVMAMFAGQVVAAKTSPPGKVEPPFGSNNFVLLRHEIPVDETDAGSRKFRFYSLYMHLHPFDAMVDKTEVQAEIDNPKLTDDDRATIAPDWVHLLRLALAGIKPEDEAAGAPPPPPPPKAEKTGDKKMGKTDEGKAKAKAKEGDDEGDEETKPAEDEALFLDIGKNLEALQNEQVALIEDRYPVWVKVGDRIGRCGEFGDTDNKSSLVHIEVFSDATFREFVDLLGAHANDWYEVNPDSSDDLNCEDGDLLRTMLPDLAGRSRRRNSNFVDAGRRISGDQIVDFYKSMPGDNPAVERVRKGITYHVSEWSDQVDWFKSLSKAQDWPGRQKDITALLKDSRQGWSDRLFAQHIRRQLPYIWLNQEVALHIGLDNAKGNWDGHAYTFHPINFLIWLTFRFGTNKMKVRATADRMSLAKQKEYRKKQEEAQRQERERGELEFGQDVMPGGGAELEPPADQLRDLW
ncbi:MAG: N-acetylmuramoyl-L-alanine amidase, partial [Deltaproteobacteria bacterium]|nr:N-acetylmuramoyl-L-alanine amidase [Deltaproteobacteria bacterium]